MENFLKVSLMTHTIIRLMFLCILQGDDNLAQVSDYIDLSFQEEEEEGSTNSQRQKRSYSYGCPEEIKISWLQAEPLVFNTSDHHKNDNKSEENTLALKGIFVDVVNNSIAFCYDKFCGGVVPNIRSYGGLRTSELFKSIF